MRSPVRDVLPQQIRRSLEKFGSDLALARKKRRLTVAMVAERVGLSKSTYVRVEKGDPTVSMGAYAMTMFVLGFGAALNSIVDPRVDDQGLLLDAQRMPKRVRVKAEPSPL